MPVDIGGMIFTVLGMILGGYYLIWFFLFLQSQMEKQKHEQSFSDDEKENLFPVSESLEDRSPEDLTSNNEPKKNGCFIWSFLMPFILIFWLLAYIIISQEIGEFLDKRIREKNGKIIDQEMAVRKKHLKEACEKESKIVVHKKIPLGSGFYADSNIYIHEQKEKLKKDMKVEIEQCETIMNLQNEETGARISAIDYCRHKYTSLIRFSNNFNFSKGGGLIKYTKAYFFEYIDYYDDNKKVFVEGVPIKQYIKGEEDHPHVYYDDRGHAIDSNKVFKRYATKAWWMHSGLGDIVTQWMRQYDESKHVENIKNNYFVDDDIPVTQLLAHYRLDVEDISTLTDRHQGIRRGRIRLVDRSHQQVLSEYITFDVASFYDDSDTEKSSRSCLNRHLSTYEIEKTSGNPEIFEYFFKHALDETQTMPLQKADRL